MLLVARYSLYGNCHVDTVFQSPRCVRTRTVDERDGSNDYETTPQTDSWVDMRCCCDAADVVLGFLGDRGKFPRGLAPPHSASATSVDVCLFVSYVCFHAAVARLCPMAVGGSFPLYRSCPLLALVFPRIDGDNSNDRVPGRAPWARFRIRQANAEGVGVSTHHIGSARHCTDCRSRTCSESFPANRRWRSWNEASEREWC